MLLFITVYYWHNTKDVCKGWRIKEEQETKVALQSRTVNKKTTKNVKSSDTYL